MILSFPLPVVCSMAACWGVVLQIDLLYSFSRKSFGKQNGMSNALPMNGHKSPLQKVLGGATQVAKRAEKQVLQVGKVGLAGGKKWAG